MSQHETLKTSWVYSLKKEELVTYLVQCGQEPSGTVDELRKRLVKIITADPEESLVEKLLEWQRQHDPGLSCSPSITGRVSNGKSVLMNPESAKLVVPTMPPSVTLEAGSSDSSTLAAREDRIATIELMRKWGVKYDGGKDILKFVVRLEELATMYEVDLNTVVPMMCELLKDRALIWFRNNRKPWEQWSWFKKDLLDFFLPQRYFEKLESEIRSRTQRPRENFKDYLLALQDLMYHANMSEDAKLEIIFRNSLPEYQWYIRRKDFSTLEELLSLAAELEGIPNPKPPGRSEHHRMLVDELPSPMSITALQQHPTCLSWEEEKIKAAIIINHQVYHAIIDTGATRSFVTPSFIKQIKLRSEPLPTGIEVALADGSKKHITTAAYVPVTFGNTSKTHEFFVMKEATEAIILGLDFLKKFNTTIVCAGLSVSSDRSMEGMTTLHGPPEKVRESNTVCPSVTTLAQKGKIQQRIQEFLDQELPKFQQIKGLSTAATHRIVMKDDRPIKIRYAPRNPAMQAVIDEEVNSLLKRGCIEPSCSPYSFPITLVKKKNGSWRTCMDFRQLNARSVPDAYPLPRIDTILDRLRNAKYISSLDLKDGYWQIPMEEESKKYTAFAVAGRGLYQWRVMPFGLHSAPATFQRALDNIIGPDMEPHAFAYLDDIIVIGKTLEEHMDNLREVFRRLRAANLRINVDKCEFFKPETRYLGHVVTSEGIKTDPEKIAAISQLPKPQDIKGVRRFLGITSWYRRFVPNFANISQPLTQLLKKGKHWKWGPEQQEAFETLKECLTKSPVLACPDFTQPFTLQTDASDYGLGAVLTQVYEGAERVIAYASRHLNGAEKNYSATEKECLAIVWGIRKMRPYLEGYEFRVITDHLSLKWLNSINNPTGRLARWALELQQYKFSVEYRKGKQNVVADALSRHPVAEILLASVQTSQSCPWYIKKLEEVRKQPELHSDYTIADNKLYRHFTREINEDDCTPWKLCIPTEQRQQVLMETHDNITGGHMGVRKTLNKVASRYYWPGMARDIARYVQQCHTCQRYKVSQQLPAGKMLTRVPEEPWSQLCADFIGPLPRTAHGNTMVLVLFDSFSKWVELIPMRKATAEGVVKALRERIVSRYGVPKILITDNGTQFTSHSLKKYLENIGVRQQFIAPYTPQENPTERANRTIKTIIAKFSGQQHNRWDEILPEVMLAMNSSESESTGYSAAFLTQGRSPRLPKALYDEDTIGTGARVIDPTHRADELQEIFKIVRRNLQTASQKQRHHYNLRRRHWTPKIGDLVLVRQHPLSKAVENFAAKLAPKFGGPYVVTGFISPVIAQLKAVDSNEKRNAHLSELKVYHPNNLNISPIFHRSTNIKLRRDGDSMETPQEKFERTRAKFRRNLEEENRKARRTAFLDDDEIPSTSKGRARGHRPQPRPRTRYPRSEPTPSSYQTTKADRAQLFRMNVVPPQDENPTQAGECRMKTPEPRAAGDDIIHISDSEDVPPPPPPLNIRSEEGAGDQTPTSLIWDDQFLSLTDLDLNDPFILELCRTLGGIDDTTVEMRPQSPPSPMSSTSSMDWESESFRPPTPPKRKGYVTLEVRDRQYPYWGMQCYEREWKARIIIPKRNTTAAIVGRPEPSATPSKRETPKTIYESPTHNCKPLHITTPPTPGRGWLNRLDELGNERNTVQHEAPTTPTTARATSPIPPPPPVIPFIHTQTPIPTPVPESLQFEDLPIDIQREINRRVNTFPTKRARFIHLIDGHPYRVNTRGDGILHVRRM